MAHHEQTETPRKVTVQRRWEETSAIASVLLPTATLEAESERLERLVGLAYEGKREERAA